MNNKIIDALSQFDIEDDSYWTEDGLPLLDAIQHIAQDETITREMVTTAAPGYSRINPSLELGVVSAEVPPEVVVTEDPVEEFGSPDTPDEELTPGKDAPILDEAEILEAAKILEEDGKKDGLSRDERDALEQEYEKQQKAIAEEIAEVVAARGKLEQKLHQLYSRESSLADKLTLLADPNKQMNAIQDYQKAQQRVRMKRGEQLQRIREAQIDLKQIIPGKAPIDASMARRNSRGTQRPRRKMLV